MTAFHCAAVIKHAGIDKTESMSLEAYDSDALDSVQLFLNWNRFSIPIPNLQWRNAIPQKVDNVSSRDFAYSIGLFG